MYQSFIAPPAALEELRYWTQDGLEPKPNLIVCITHYGPRDWSAWWWSALMAGNRTSKQELPLRCSPDRRRQRYWPRYNYHGYRFNHAPPAGRSAFTETHGGSS